MLRAGMGYIASSLKKGNATREKPKRKSYMNTYLSDDVLAAIRQECFERAVRSGKNTREGEVVCEWLRASMPTASEWLCDVDARAASREKAAHKCTWAMDDDVRSWLRVTCAQSKLAGSPMTVRAIIEHVVRARA